MKSAGYMLFAWIPPTFAAANITSSGLNSSKNSLTIFGKNTFKKKNSLIKIDSKNDHRIAMSTAILAMSTGTRLLIKNFETVNTSSPSFLKIIKLLGGKFEIKRKL